MKFEDIEQGNVVKFIDRNSYERLGIKLGSTIVTPNGGFTKDRTKEIVSVYKIKEDAIMQANLHYWFTDDNILKYCNTIWEKSPFEDGEVIWCWNNECDAIPRRWDSINDVPCWRSGKRNGPTWDNYKKFVGELPFDLPRIKD